MRYSAVFIEDDSKLAVSAQFSAHPTYYHSEIGSYLESMMDWQRTQDRNIQLFICEVDAITDLADLQLHYHVVAHRFAVCGSTEHKLHSI
jgi:hypothetical protein